MNIVKKQKIIFWLSISVASLVMLLIIIIINKNRAMDRIIDTAKKEAKQTGKKR